MCIYLFSNFVILCYGTCVFSIFYGGTCVFMYFLILFYLAYFLNPTLQYFGTCVFNLDEVRKGLKKVIVKLEPNLAAQVDTIDKVFF